MLLTEPRNPRAMYFTQSWLEDGQFIGNAYARDVARLGVKKANAVYRMMLQGYQSLTLLNTGAFDVPSARQTLETCGKALALPVEETTGNTQILKELLHNPDAPYFWKLPPGETFSLLAFLEKKAFFANNSSKT